MTRPCVAAQVHTAGVLARVEMGERVEITREGVPVAIIEPAVPHPLRTLIESGELRPARDALSLFSESEALAPDSEGLVAILGDRYGERPWVSGE